MQRVHWKFLLEATLKAHWHPLVYDDLVMLYIPEKTINLAIHQDKSHVI